MSTAFILSAPVGAALTLSSPQSLSTRSLSHRVSLSRRAYICMGPDEAVDTKASKVPEVPDYHSETKPETDYEAPSFDTEVFSKFVDTATEKFDELKNQYADVDTEELVDTVKDASIGLIDNLIAGDWLNRGELYGAIQLAFVILLLRGPGFLDGMVGFVTGPALLLLGAAISGKAVYDLGRKQLSIWPAPVPNGQLQTNGMYEYVRHPIYSGLILASTGFSVATGSPARLAITLAMTAFLLKKIEVEETYLEDAYEAYQDYAEMVPFKIIPRLF